MDEDFFAFLKKSSIWSAVGQPAEINEGNIKTKSFPFFAKDCAFTDDTVMTLTVAVALMQGGAPNDFIDVSCQGSVLEAVIAFLESRDFEDTIRNAISMGGVSDTIAAITGGITEAAYGIPGETPINSLCGKIINDVQGLPVGRLAHGAQEPRHI